VLRAPEGTGIVSDPSVTAPVFRTDPSNEKFPKKLKELAVFAVIPLYPLTGVNTAVFISFAGALVLGVTTKDHVKASHDTPVRLAEIVTDGAVLGPVEDTLDTA